MSDKAVLTAVLGDYPHTQALKRGEVRSERVELAFTEFKPTNRAFKPMAREQRFDVSEMAIVTFLQAIAHGKPLALLPAVVLQRLPHAMLISNAEKAPLGPGDLAGRRIGVRSYTTTTGVWLRGILQDEHGFDPKSVRWITCEDPHVAEYVDPTERAPEGVSPVEMLLAGELDAVLGETASDPRLRPVFSDPQAAGQSWYAKHRFVPINHMVVVKRDLIEEHPEQVAEAYDLLVRSSEAAGATRTGPAATTCFGVEATRPALETIVRYAVEQGLIPAPVAVDELYLPWLRRAEARNRSVR